MPNRWRAHVSGAVTCRELRSKLAARAAAASASVGAASKATYAGSSRRPAARSANRSANSDDTEDDINFGTTLYMRNRWRAHVSGAEHGDDVLGFGSSDDDESSRSSSPPSSPGRFPSEPCPEDEPFEEDEKVVAEWRMNSYATSTIVRIVCCRLVTLFLFLNRCYYGLGRWCWLGSGLGLGYSMRFSFVRGHFQKALLH